MVTDFPSFPSLSKKTELSLDSLHMEGWIVRLLKNPDPSAQFRLIVKTIKTYFIVQSI